MKEYRMYGKPGKSKKGRELIEKMNIHHKSMGDWFFEIIQIKEGEISLDIGCGGGVNVKRLSENSKKVYGIDISKMSTIMSEELNKEEIKNNKVKILNIPIEETEFETSYFSLVTAFETIYFWKDIKNSFKKVYNFLKDNGRFYLIFNSFSEQKNWKKTPLLNLINENEILELLMDLNFKTRIFKHSTEPWIIIEGIK